MCARVCVRACEFACLFISVLFARRSPTQVLSVLVIHFSAFCS